MSTTLDIVRIPVLNDNYVWLMREPQSGAVGVVDPAVAGPVLAEAPWDSLLVVEARCDADGALVLRVEPMTGEVVNAALQFTSLTPGASYQVEADGQLQRFVAAGDGTGSVQMSIDAPVRMRLYEVAS